ncbi:MAG: hypothetical protein RJB51_357 [Actinomycetota bacterium]|jgi:hypothetical protein
MRSEPHQMDQPGSTILPKVSLPLLDERAALSFCKDLKAINPVYFLERRLLCQSE